MTTETLYLEACADAFVKRVESKKLVIGIVGLGYVGLPLARAYIDVSLNVVGYDINEAKLAQLRSGQSGIRHIEDSFVKKSMADGSLQVTSDITDLKQVDAILICVPTPLDIHQQPDLSYVVSTCEALAPVLQKGQIVILESTTYPGTTEEVIKPILESTGMKAGIDFALAYSPEREDPGNKDFHTGNIPKVIGADSPSERKIAEATYSSIVKTVMVSNSKTAEATKLVENIFRWVNIALSNELKVIFEKMGIDVWEVIDAAASKPFGFMPFYPGPGVGGHCIRIDPYYLSWKAKEFGLSTEFIELAGSINIQMPRRVVQMLMEAMNLKLKKAISGSRILLCGIAYKKNVDDMRESPSLELITLLREHGAHVEYYDPFIEEVKPNRDHPELSGMKSIDFTPENLQTFDVALIATGHDGVDYKTLVSHVPLLVDTQNALKEFADEFSDKIVKA
ncbi:MAG: UDP-N-acetyl-D-glucosamine dehydrogenase [Robiginitomaculum sp.]|nr:MAG: UDP-N-acetyl-D-glucosamine dehydrogenase [Robiginitomaculum sp.]